MTKIYCAAGWFSPNMEKAIKDIEEVIDETKLRAVTFEPRNDTGKHFGGSNGPDWNGVFDDNVKHLKEAKLIIVSTVDKDMGTIWEAGYASALGKTIIYYNPFMESKEQFNLMLAKSGVGVCVSKAELKDFVLNFFKYDFNGNIE